MSAYDFCLPSVNMSDTWVGGAGWKSLKSFESSCIHQPLRLTFLTKAGMHDQLWIEVTSWDWWVGCTKWAPVRQLATTELGLGWGWCRCSAGQVQGAGAVQVRVSQPLQMQLDPLQVSTVGEQQPRCILVSDRLKWKLSMKYVLILVFHCTVKDYGCMLCILLSNLWNSNLKCQCWGLG